MNSRTHPDFLLLYVRQALIILLYGTLSLKQVFLGKNSDSCRLSPATIYSSVMFIKTCPVVLP